MMTPYLDLDTIKDLASTKALNDREKILSAYETPRYKDMKGVK